jgi:diguanylate cyclase (GGDEF)-like protein
LSYYKNDARFQELEYLAQFERTRWVDELFPGSGSFERDKKRQMIASLILRGMLNGPDVQAKHYTPGKHSSAYANLGESMEQYIRTEQAQLIHALMNGERVNLEMGHLGRLRLFELQDQLRATRQREAFGILFDARDVERDVAVAILNSRPDSPVSLAYLDMNGLKAFNEDGDHATGDAAIKAFFHVLEKAVSGVGDAYRKGGDEVVVIMPGTPLAEARRCMRGALMSLAKEEISVKGVRRKLSSACGIVEVTSPQAEAVAAIHRADLVQKEAKAASKRPDATRSSALAVQGEKEVELLDS